MWWQNYNRRLDLLCPPLRRRGFFCFGNRTQQFRQLSNIPSNEPRLIEGQCTRDVRLIGCVASVDIDESLTVCVQHLVAARYLLNLPECRETA
jgi:hypothetical protein